MRRRRTLSVWAAWLALVAGCGGELTLQPAQQRALIVVSPHPDDESIFGGATIHRIAADPAGAIVQGRDGDQHIFDGCRAILNPKA